MTDDKCSLCDEGNLSVGEKSGYGAAVVLKTGSNLDFDWYATLQPSTMTNPNTGIHCLLMPLDHVGSFAEINRPRSFRGLGITPLGMALNNGKNRKFAENFGIATGILSYAMQHVLELEWDEGMKQSDGVWDYSRGAFVPQQIIYGKHAEGRNTKPGHIHLRFTDFSGSLAQAYPSDNEWRKRQVLSDEAGEEYVKALPTKSQKFSPERFEKLRSKLVEICNQF